MARSCGIRLGSRHFEVVVLEGSVKNPKVKLQLAGEIEPGEDPVEAIGGALRERMRGEKFARENVSLAIDGGLAAYRSVTLPFDDKAKAEQVIKFEVESELPQWEIDDVVVDFHITNSTGVQSQALVTAVPKAEVAERVAACEGAGLEPQEVELEGTALVNAAQYAGLLGIESAQILVHVGDHSTSVVVVDGGRVSSLRAIQIGAVVREDSPPAVEVTGEVVAGEEGEESASASPPPPVDTLEVERRLGEARARLQRELGRTVAGIQTAQPLETIYLCGGEIPGLVGSNIMDVPVERLEIFPGGEGTEGAGERTPVVAFGTAWRALGGGVMKPSLRREELRFTGRLERLELPLAVVGLLLVTTLAVQWIVTGKQIVWREADDLQTWLVASSNYLEFNLPDMPDGIRNYVETAQADKDTVRTKFGQLERIYELLDDEINRVRKVLGQDADITKPQSALEAATLVLGTLEGLGEDVGRFSIRELTSTFVPGKRGRSTDKVQLKMDLTFFGSATDSTAHFLAFQDALRDQPWCLGAPDKATDNLDGGGGIFVQGFACDVDLSKVQRDVPQPAGAQPG